MQHIINETLSKFVCICKNKLKLLSRRHLKIAITISSSVNYISSRKKYTCILTGSSSLLLALNNNLDIFNQIILRTGELSYLVGIIL